MTETRTCPRCGRVLPDDAPRGLCPACLLGAALAGPGITAGRHRSLDEVARSRDGDTATDPIQTDGRTGSVVETLSLVARDPDAAASPAPEATIRYFGDYELEAEIAHGGMGVVYRARQVSLDRTVALKMILAGQLASTAEVRRFRTEAEAAAQLDHPGIVPIFEVGEHQGRHYFSMGYIPGQSLAHAIAGGPLPQSRAAEILREVAEAVAYAHSRGVVHRDLKPGNILLDAQGRPHVTDFGLAKRTEVDSSLTQSGVIMGTPSYMSPEQAEARHDRIGPSTDIYSLGATLYCLLTGSPPFQAPSMADTLRQVAEREPVPPRQLNPEIALDLETICLKCLEKPIARRYASAADLTADLGRWLEGRPILARPVGPAERAWRWCARNAVVAALGAGLWLALLTGIALSSYFAYRARIGESDALESARQLRVEKEATERQSRQISLERERAETLLYGTEMTLAQRDLGEGDLEAAGQRLADNRPAAQDRPDRRGFEWYYLDRLCNLELMRLFGPGLPVTSVALSPDGRLIVTGYVTGYGFLPDGTIAVWDAPGRRLLTSWRAGDTSIGALAFHPEGKLLVSIDPTSPTITLWDVATGHEWATLRGHDDGVTQIAFSPDGSILASSDRSGVVKLWDIPPQDRLERTLIGHKGRVSRMAFSPDGRLLATGSLDWRRITIDGPTDGSIRIWDVATGRQLAVLAQPDGGILDLAFSPDGTQLLSSSGDGMARLWDVKESRQIQSTRGPATGLAVFLPEGPRIVSPGGEIRVWDALTGQTLVSFPGRFGPASREQGISLNAMAIRPDGRLLVTSFGGGISLWDVSAPPEPLILSTGCRGVEHVAFSADNRLLAAGGEDTFVRVFDLEGGWESVVLASHERGGGGRIMGLAFRSDGHLVSVGSDAALRVWDPETGRLEQTFRCITDGKPEPTPAAPTSVAAEADRIRGPVPIPAPWPPSPAPVPVIPLSPDQESPRNIPDRRPILPPAAAATEADRIRGPDRESPPAAAPAGVVAVRFGLGGRRVAVANEFGTIGYWDTATGGRLWSRKVDPQGFRGMSFLPDGRLMVAAEMDGKVVMRDAETSAVIPSNPDARGGVAPSSWLATPSETSSPDGRRVATASGREIKILDTGTRREILSIKGGASLVSFSDDGRLLAAVSGDGSIHVWDGRETTPQLKARREARSLVRWLAPRCRDRAELLARIRGDAGLTETVRQASADLARRRPEPSLKQAVGRLEDAARQP
jgi:WD40 repeat protein/tRNA A-37 threonylcarbamoyl transferase component Bud32